MYTKNIIQTSAIAAKPTPTSATAITASSLPISRCRSQERSNHRQNGYFRNTPGVNSLDHAIREQTQKKKNTTDMTREKWNKKKDLGAKTSLKIEFEMTSFEVYQC